MTGRLRFVPRLPKRERELIVDAPDACIIAWQCAGKRQRPAERFGGFAWTAQRKMRTPQVIESFGWRRLGSSGDLQVWERFGVAPRFYECHAESKVRQHVARR